MPEYPYMQSVGNVPAVLERLREAGTPPRFTHEFLRNNLGFTSSNDRGIIKVLKGLGFLTPDGSPTARYNEFRGDAGGLALATGLREGWPEIFLSDQRAHEKSAGVLKDLFKSVTGKGDAVAEKMATTFRCFASQADWTAATPSALGEPTPERQELPQRRQPEERGAVSLHHDVHIHLPPTSDVAVYAAIFRALRQELLD